MSALSLMRYSYFRGGTGYPKSVPISPTFNPVVLDYYAITDAGTYAVYPETGTPDTKMTVSFKSQADTASQGKPTDNGYVPAGTQGDFLVVVQDTVKDLETTYLIRVEAH